MVIASAVYIPTLVPLLLDLLQNEELIRVGLGYHNINDLDPNAPFRASITHTSTRCLKRLLPRNHCR